MSFSKNAPEVTGEQICRIIDALDHRADRLANVLNGRSSSGIPTSPSEDQMALLYSICTALGLDDVAAAWSARMRREHRVGVIKETLLDHDGPKERAQEIAEAIYVRMLDSGWLS